MSGSDAGYVLVADDDADVRYLIELTLVRAGFDVVAARDGHSALELVSRRAPRLVIVDRRMPRLGGLEVIECLRAQESTRTVPVIMLTASAEGTSEEEGLTAGADRYLTKPFNPRLLVGVVEELLETSAAD